MFCGREARPTECSSIEVPLHQPNSQTAAKLNFSLSSTAVHSPSHDSAVPGDFGVLPGGVAHAAVHVACGGRQGVDAGVCSGSDRAASTPSFHSAQ